MHYSRHRRERRKQQGEELENHERWLVSYADFITLMFAFFVVMYAISSVNEGKYKVLGDALNLAFRAAPGDTTGAAPVSISPNVTAPMFMPLRRTPAQVKQDEATRQLLEKMRAMMKEIRTTLAPLVQEGLVNVTEGPRGVTVDFDASVLFAPGDARLDTSAIRALVVVAQIVAPATFPITVEGHTDNVPISTPLYPSNWELSGNRASSVVRLFIESGVSPKRLTAIGYADQRPVADNSTQDGRQKNRRVSIVMEAMPPQDSRAPENILKQP
ncbi:flagellar motor protein MotD [Denitratisoma sp. agr-D3]